jgi:hypothetical protein
VAFATAPWAPSLLEYPLQVDIFAYLALVTVRADDSQICLPEMTKDTSAIYSNQMHHGALSR